MFNIRLILCLCNILVFIKKGNPCKADNDNGTDMDIGDGKLYAGFFIQSYGTSGKITFNICKKNKGQYDKEQYDCSHPGGDITLLGGPRMRKTISTLPTKIEISEKAKKAGIIKVDDVRFLVTSIQDTNGNRIEKEVFQPIRVFRPKIRCYDFYTIFFNTSVIQPPIIEITKKVKFKIESPNKKIFQVNTEDDYKKCNKQNIYCMDNNYQLGYTNYKCDIGNGNRTKTDTGNIGNGYQSMNISNHNGTYYLFDKDGLPKSCAGGAPSNGSKVQIILTEFKHESGGGNTSKNTANTSQNTENTSQNTSNGNNNANESNDNGNIGNGNNNANEGNDNGNTGNGNGNVGNGNNNATQGDDNGNTGNGKDNGNEANGNGNGKIGKENGNVGNGNNNATQGNDNGNTDNGKGNGNVGNGNNNANEDNDNGNTGNGNDNVGNGNNNANEGNDNGNTGNGINNATQGNDNGNAGNGNGNGKIGNTKVY